MRLVLGTGIGGGIHNYQRYSVRVEDGRRIQYIVSGGGGAYVGATHRIPYINLSGVDENDFRCYPRGGDSLCLFSNLYERRFGFGKGRFGIPPEAAATYIAERLGIPPTRHDQIDTHDKTRARRSVELVLPLPGRGKEPLHDALRPASYLADQGEQLALQHARDHKPVHLYPSDEQPPVTEVRHRVRELA